MFHSLLRKECTNLGQERVSEFSQFYGGITLKEAFNVLGKNG